MIRAPRLRANLSDSLHRRLNMYVLAASAAGVGVLSSPPTANAKIIYTPAHAKVIFGRPVALDLNHDGIIDFYLNINAEYQMAELGACQFLASGTHGPFCTSMAGTNAVRVTKLSTYFAAALRYGARIQRGDRFRSGGVVLGGLDTHGFGSSTTWYGPWVSGGKGVKNRFLGLKFKTNGRFHFGWARITVTTTKNSFTAILTGYAYETIPGKAIIAGATKGPNDELTTSLNTHAPQPATLGMLALGAPGMSIWKREESVAVAPEGI
jgi:hypothetical protein